MVLFLQVQATLVPVADLLDHKPGEAAQWGVDPATGAYFFELTSGHTGKPEGTDASQSSLNHKLFNSVLNHSTKHLTGSLDSRAAVCHPKGWQFDSH